MNGLRCLLVLFVWLVGPFDGTVGLYADTPKKAPNILFILVDDQSPFDLRVYNSDSELKTPNIDRLAKQGMVLDAAYHMGSYSGAVCSPSRHMIMTGRTVWHLPTAPQGKQLSPPGLEQNSLPAVFQRAGYATMRTCKMGNSYEAANALFEVRRDATKRGPMHSNGSGWHGDQVIDYLQQRVRNQDKRPFLIYYGFSHPHDTRDAPESLLAKYGATNHADPNTLPPANAGLPNLPKNYLPAHPFDMTHADVRDEVAVSGVWQRRDPVSIRNEIGRQYACSENIDMQIGRVLDQLAEMDELENTYIIYTADHGMSIGRHGLMGKQNLYEHTWRVPLIAVGPGIPSGSRAPGNVYLTDLLATFCDICGIVPPDTNEGTSFRPVLNASEQRIRNVMYGVYSGGSKPGIRCVREGDWKLIEYEATDRQVRQSQLFNLLDNPEELLLEHHQLHLNTSEQRPHVHRNLANDPEHAGRLTQMRELLRSEMNRLDDPHRITL